jgi:hypothetical protein
MSKPEHLIPELYINQIKHSLTQRVSFLPPLTPEQEAARLERREAWAAYDAALRALLAEADDATIRAVADLHKEDEFGHCAGCDFDGYDAGPGDWPCQTSVLLGTILGLESP